VEKPVVTIALKPRNHFVNPVFELCDAPKTLACLSLDGKRLNPLQYARDGMTLWLNVTFSHPAELKLEFGTEKMVRDRVRSTDTHVWRHTL
jgi:hypothetical protein